MRGRAPQIVANQVSDKTKQPSRNSVYRKKTHTHRATRAVAVLVRWQVVLVFLSSAVALCCPSQGEEGSFPLSLSVLFFVSGGSSHGRTSLGLCLVRPTVLSLSLSQLERTRAVHVTSRLAEQTSEARRGRCRALTDPAYYLWDTPTLVPHFEENSVFVLSDRYQQWLIIVCVCCSDKDRKTHVRSDVT